MHSSTFLLAGFAASYAAADEITYWAGDGCRGQIWGGESSIPNGRCFEFPVNAKSFLIEKDPAAVYNLYSGGCCHQYGGSYSIDKLCMAIGDGITGWVKRPSHSHMIRGATRDTKREDDATVGILQDGDTYQCPNIPSGADYLLLVTSSSAAHEEVSEADETSMRNEFMNAFNEQYQNPGGQTSVSTFFPYDGPEIEDIQFTLAMSNGVIQDFQPNDMESIVADIFNFRDAQRSPINFIVFIYSGRLDNPGGLLGAFSWRGD